MLLALEIIGHQQSCKCVITVLGWTSWKMKWAGRNAFQRSVQNVRYTVGQLRVYSLGGTVVGCGEGWVRVVWQWGMFAFEAWCMKTVQTAGGRLEYNARRHERKFEGGEFGTADVCGRERHGAVRRIFSVLARSNCRRRDCHIHINRASEFY